MAFEKEPYDQNGQQDPRNRKDEIECPVSRNLQEMVRESPDQVEEVFKHCGCQGSHHPDDDTSEDKVSVRTEQAPEAVG